MTREAIYREITLCACLDARLRAYAAALTTMRYNAACRAYEPVSTPEEIEEAARLVRDARAELALHDARRGGR
jgi:hypothetical protein